MKISDLLNYLRENKVWIEEDFFIRYEYLVLWIEKNMEKNIEELKVDIEFLKTNLFSLIERVEELEHSKNINL